MMRGIPKPKSQLTKQEIAESYEFGKLFVELIVNENEVYNRKDIIKHPAIKKLPVDTQNLLIDINNFRYNQKHPEKRKRIPIIDPNVKQIYNYIIANTDNRILTFPQFCNIANH